MKQLFCHNTVSSPDTTTNNTKSNTADFLHLYRSPPQSGVATSASHNKYHMSGDKVTVTTRRNKLSPRGVASFDEVTDAGTEITESILDTTIGGDNTTIGSITMADTTMDTCTMGDITMDTNNSGRTSHYCPCVQTCLDEMNGTYQDMKKTFNQVFYAFVVSGDDIDRVVSLFYGVSLSIIICIFFIVIYAL